MCITWKVHTHTDLIEKNKCQCHKTSKRNLWNYGTNWNIQKEQIKKFPLAKNQPVITLFSNLLCLIETE